MADKTGKHERHFLFHGELSDAPGRNESWDDYLQYRGKSRWELITEGTDFDGNPIESIKQVMSTRALVNWVLDRDEDIREGARQDDDDGYEARADRVSRQFGPYGERLREIADSVGALYCVSCLDGWCAGTWPRERRQPAVRILAIKGITRRGVWISVYHQVYDVESNLGPAFLYPPDGDRAAKLILKTESSVSEGRVVKVPKVFMEKINALRPSLETLRSL